MADIKQAILDFAENSKKTKFYFNDIQKAVRKVFPDAKAREVKKAATALINEEKLVYFSTGSTTMYGLKGRGQTEDHRARVGGGARHLRRHRAAAQRDPGNRLRARRAL